MFVSKKKYNELKEAYDKLIKLNNENCKRCRHKEQTFESRIKTRDSKIDTLESTVRLLESQHMPIPGGRRLTEEELSTLIAVDFISLIDKELHKVGSNFDLLFDYAELENDLAEGLFNG